MNLQSTKKSLTKSPNLQFEYPEDNDFFATFLTGGDTRKLEREYGEYFDFRDPLAKRREFNLIRKNLLPQLLKRDSGQCQLKFDCCDNKKLVVDHLIPLSSNKLNRKLRGQKTEDGKKPKAQSFGSNNPKNLLIACDRCNSYKKHRLFNILTKQLI